MRVRALVLLAASTAACGRGSPRPPTVPPAPPATVTPAAPARTPEVMAALAITGASWEAALARVPAAQARRVAIDFLQEGGFACAQVVEEEVGCGATELAFEPVEAGATIEEPCLRRHVARWALQQVEATDVPAIEEALLEIVALPLPERELAAEVIALVPPGEDELRLRLIAAAREDVGAEIIKGLTPFGAAEALLELGREEAFAYLGDHPQPATLAAALEQGFSVATTREILERLDPEDLEHPAVAEAVRRAATGDSCVLAAAAAALFDEAGDSQYLPSHANVTTEAAATRALCVAGQVSTDEALAVLRSMVARDGLDLVVVERGYWLDEGEVDPDLDGDGDPHTSSTRTHVAPGALDGDALVEWLPTECDGGACLAPGGAVTLGFSRTPRGGLSLDEIAVERHEHTCGC